MISITTELNMSNNGSSVVTYVVCEVSFSLQTLDCFLVDSLALVDSVDAPCPNNSASVSVGQGDDVLWPCSGTVQVTCVSTPPAEVWTVAFVCVCSWGPAVSLLTYSWIVEVSCTSTKQHLLITACKMLIQFWIIKIRDDTVFSTIKCLIIKKKSCASHWCFSWL